MGDDLFGDDDGIADSLLKSSRSASALQSQKYSSNLSGNQYFSQAVPQSASNSYSQQQQQQQQQQQNQRLQMQQRLPQQQLQQQTQQPQPQQWIEQNQARGGLPNHPNQTVSRPQTHAVQQNHGSHVHVNQRQQAPQPQGLVPQGHPNHRQQLSSQGLVPQGHVSQRQQVAPPGHIPQGHLIRRQQAPPRGQVSQVHAAQQRQRVGSQGQIPQIHAAQQSQQVSSQGQVPQVHTTQQRQQASPQGQIPQGLAVQQRQQVPPQGQVPQAHTTQQRQHVPQLTQQALMNNRMSGAKPQMPSVPVTYAQPQSRGHPAPMQPGPNSVVPSGATVQGQSRPISTQRTVAAPQRNGSSQNTSRTNAIRIDGLFWTRFKDFLCVRKPQVAPRIAHLLNFDNVAQIGQAEQHKMKMHLRELTEIFGESFRYYYQEFNSICVKHLLVAIKSGAGEAIGGRFSSLVQNREITKCSQLNEQIQQFVDSAKYADIMQAFWSTLQRHLVGLKAQVQRQAYQKAQQKDGSNLSTQRIDPNRARQQQVEQSRQQIYERQQQQQLRQQQIPHQQPNHPLGTKSGTSQVPVGRANHSVIERERQDMLLAEKIRKEEQERQRINALQQLPKPSIPTINRPNMVARPNPMQAARGRLVHEMLCPLYSERIDVCMKKGIESIKPVSQVSVNPNGQAITYLSQALNVFLEHTLVDLIGLSRHREEGNLHRKRNLTAANQSDSLLARAQLVERNNRLKIYLRAKESDLEALFSYMNEKNEKGNTTNSRKRKNESITDGARKRSLHKQEKADEGSIEKQQKQEKASLWSEYISQRQVAERRIKVADHTSRTVKRSILECAMPLSQKSVVEIKRPDLRTYLTDFPTKSQKAWSRVLNGSLAEFFH